MALTHHFMPQVASQSLFIMTSSMLMQVKWGKQDQRHLEGTSESQAAHVLGQGCRSAGPSLALSLPCII